MVFAFMVVAFMVFAFMVVAFIAFIVFMGAIMQKEGGPLGSIPNTP